MKPARILQLALMTLVLVSFIGSVTAASSAYIRSVGFSEDPIVPEEDFEIEVKVRNIESSMEVWIYFDDESIPFRKIVVGPDSQDNDVKVDKSEWEDDQQLIRLKCGTHTVRADLVKFGDVRDSISIELDVGNVPVLRFSPERPVPGSDFKIYFEDKDTGGLVERLSAEIGFIGEETETVNSGTIGYVNYEASKPGRYKLTIDTRRGYCGEMFFYIKRNMLIDGPFPDKPLVGDMITIAVPSYKSSVPGVRVFGEDGHLYLAAKTFLSGSVNFTINDPGTYTAVIGEDDRYYWGVNATVVVSPRPLMSATLNPTNPYVQSPVTVTVKAGETPLANARVKVITPEGIQREYVTLANGKAIYDGITTMGEYTVIVEKTGYEQFIKTFYAKNGFIIDFQPEVPLLNSEVTLTAKDQDDNVVPDAEVSISELEILGATDTEGRYSFTLTEPDQNVDPGDYTLIVQKDNFWTLNQNILTQDTMALSFSENIQVSEDVTVQLKNSRGGLVGDTSVNIKVTSPDNTVTTLNKAEFVFKPVLVGDYKIDATKNRYKDVTETMTVKARPLTVQSTVEGRYVIVGVMSDEEPVEGLAVKVSMRGGEITKSEFTDLDGFARILIESEGEVEISVNEEDTVNLYEVTSTTRYIMRSYRVGMLSLIVLVILAGALVIAYLIYHFRTQHHRKEKVRFESKGRSSLSKI